MNTQTQEKNTSPHAKHLQQGRTFTSTCWMLGKNYKGWKLEITCTEGAISSTSTTASSFPSVG